MKNNLFEQFEQMEKRATEEEWFGDFGEIIFYAFRNNLSKGKFNMTLKELFNEIKDEFNETENRFN